MLTFQRDLMFAPSGVSPIQDYYIPCVGSSVRCVSSTEDFLISLDDGPSLAFGAGREITLKSGESFSRLRISSLLGHNDNSISLVIGDSNFDDDRVFIASNQTVRESSADYIDGVDFALTATAVWDPLPVTGFNRIKVFNIRNMDPALPVRINSGGAPAGAGVYIGPGEDMDFPVNPAALNGTILAKGTIGQILNISVIRYV